jgi:hypothetical protein
MDFSSPASPRQAASSPEERVRAFVSSQSEIPSQAAITGFLAGLLREREPLDEYFRGFLVLCPELAALYDEDEGGLSAPSSGVCAKALKVGEAAYMCRTCGADDTCILCSECFSEDAHEGHSFFMVESGGGLCDCGDPEAFAVEGWCAHHRGQQEQLQDNKDQNDVKLSPESALLVERVASAVITLLTNAHVPCVVGQTYLSSSREVLEWETNRPASFLFLTCAASYSSSTQATLNRKSRTPVIKYLGAHFDLTSSEALCVWYTAKVFGKSRVPIGRAKPGQPDGNPTPEQKAAAEAMQAQELWELKNEPASQLLDAQDDLDDMYRLLTALCRFPSLQALLTELFEKPFQVCVAGEDGSCAMIDAKAALAGSPVGVHCMSYLDAFVVGSHSTARNRKDEEEDYEHRVLEEFLFRMLSFPGFKRAFGLTLITHRESIVAPHSGLPLATKITSFDVQIFTTPSVSLHLTRTTRCVERLCRAVMACDPSEANTNFYLSVRCLYYVLSCKPVGEYIWQQEPDLACLTALLDLFDFFSLACAVHQRQVTDVSQLNPQHAWRVFSCMIALEDVSTALSEALFDVLHAAQSTWAALGGDGSRVRNLYALLYRYDKVTRVVGREEDDTERKDGGLQLVEDGFIGLSEEVVLDAPALMPNGDVFSHDKHISFHIPLHRLRAHLTLALISHDVTGDCWNEIIQSDCMPVEQVWRSALPSCRLLAARAHAHANLWVRNPEFSRFAALYEDYFMDDDYKPVYFALQHPQVSVDGVVAALLLDFELADVFDVTLTCADAKARGADLYEYAARGSEKMECVVEEFLVLMIRLEQTRVFSTASEDDMRLELRAQITDQLMVQPLPMSALLENIDSKDHDKVARELAEIATFVKSSSIGKGGVFSLHPKCAEDLQFNFYSQALDNDAQRSARESFHAYVSKMESKKSGANSPVAILRNEDGVIFPPPGLSYRRRHPTLQRTKGLLADSAVLHAVIHRSLSMVLRKTAHAGRLWGVMCPISSSALSACVYLLSLAVSSLENQACDAEALFANLFSDKFRLQDDDACTANVALKTCSMPGCFKEGLKRCSKCGSAAYCEREHQAAHWTAHKRDCRAPPASGQKNSPRFEPSKEPASTFELLCVLYCAGKRAASASQMETADATERKLPFGIASDLPLIRFVVERLALHDARADEMAKAYGIILKQDPDAARDNKRKESSKDAKRKERIAKKKRKMMAKFEKQKSDFIQANQEEFDLELADKVHEGDTCCMICTDSSSNSNAAGKLMLLGWEEEGDWRSFTGPCRPSSEPPAYPLFEPRPRLGDNDPADAEGSSPLTGWCTTRRKRGFCGHFVHENCLSAHVSGLLTREMQGRYYEGKGLVDLSRNELLCPLCKSLANTTVCLLESEGKAMDEDALTPSEATRVLDELAAAQSAEQEEGDETEGKRISFHEPDIKRTMHPAVVSEAAFMRLYTTIKCIEGGSRNLDPSHVNCDFSYMSAVELQALGMWVSCIRGELERAGSPPKLVWDDPVACLLSAVGMDPVAVLLVSLLALPTFNEGLVRALFWRTLQAHAYAVLLTLSECDAPTDELHLGAAVDAKAVFSDHARILASSGMVVAISQTSGKDVPVHFFVPYFLPLLRACSALWACLQLPQEGFYGDPKQCDVNELLEAMGLPGMEAMLQAPQWTLDASACMQLARDTPQIASQYLSTTGSYYVFDLPPLPAKFYDLVHLSTQSPLAQACRECKADEKQARLLCLACGAGVCSIECSRGHVADACSASKMGIFLDVRGSQTIITNTEGMTMYFTPMYLDSNGEGDRGLRRGVPLTLDADHREHIRSVLAQKNLAQSLAKSYRQLRDR